MRAKHAARLSNEIAADQAYTLRMTRPVHDSEGALHEA